jgi:hypothetical protein
MQNTVLVGRIEVADHAVADLDRCLWPDRHAIEEATERGRTSTALSAMEGAGPAQSLWVSETGRPPLGSSESRTRLPGRQGRRIETEAAPVRYVAELPGTDTGNERTIRCLFALGVLITTAPGADRSLLSNAECHMAFTRLRAHCIENPRTVRRRSGTRRAP